MKDKKILAVLGAGNMGTAVAQILASNGHKVKLWNWEGDLEPLKQINKYHENKKYLPGIKLSANILATEKISDALEDASVVFFVVPTKVMEHTISFAARNIINKAVLVDFSKGINPFSLQLTSSIIKKHVRTGLKKNIVTVSGPAIAQQMVERTYTAMNIAGKNPKAISEVKKVMENDYIRLVATDDVIGVEVGGSFKNVYSIAMGICDALGYGMNTKAALIVRAIGEISELTKAMGGRRETAYQLAGLGDLIGTSLCNVSRNRTFGEYLGKGYNEKEAIKKVKQTVEGIEAAKCLKKLGERYKVKLPFAEAVYQCIYSKKSARKIIDMFLKSF